MEFISGKLVLELSGFCHPVDWQSQIAVSDTWRFAPVLVSVALKFRFVDIWRDELTFGFNWYRAAGRSFFLLNLHGFPLAETGASPLFINTFLRLHLRDDWANRYLRVASHLCCHLKIFLRSLFGASSWVFTALIYEKLTTDSHCLSVLARSDCARLSAHSPLLVILLQHF